MRRILANLLFRLLGESQTRVYGTQYLFGASTFNHKGRVKRWEKALVRLYHDKDLLDFLYYQAEADKENLFRGKISPEVARGARIRTLFIVHSARLSYLENRKRGKSAGENERVDEEIAEQKKVYQKIVEKN